MLNDDQEDFLRDFDILSSQTFLDFHNLIRESVELPGNELASFFVCDRNWRKKKEITLINMLEESQQEVDEDDDRRTPRKNRIPVCEMDKVKIKEIIDDPHQRLLYEYDFLNPKSFFVELMKIVDADKAATYPVCIKSTGKFVTAVPLPFIDSIDVDDDNIALLNEFDDIMDNDEDEPDIPLFESEP
jgi:hypothetical protein